MDSSLSTSVSLVRSEFILMVKVMEMKTKLELMFYIKRRQNMDKRHDIKIQYN